MARSTAVRYDASSRSCAVVTATRPPSPTCTVCTRPTSAGSWSTTAPADSSAADVNVHRRARASAGSGGRMKTVLARWPAATTWATSQCSPGVSPAASAMARASCMRSATCAFQVSSERCSRAAPREASERPGLPTATTGPYVVSFPGHGLLERVTAPEREQLEEGSTGRGDGREREGVIVERAQVQHRRTVIHRQQAPGVRPAERAGHAEQRATEHRHQEPADGEGEADTPRREAEEVRPTQLGERGLEDQVAQALEGVGDPDAEHGQRDDADERAGGPGQDERRALLPAVRSPPARGAATSW